MRPISSNKLADLEAQVTSLLAHLEELKRRNAHLEERLREVDERLSIEHAMVRRWEKERGWLRSKLNSVLGDLEAIEFSEPSLRD